jgi:hypothetical protein
MREMSSRRAGVPMRWTDWVREKTYASSRHTLSVPR